MLTIIVYEKSGSGTSVRLQADYPDEDTAVFLLGKNVENGCELLTSHATDEQVEDVRKIFLVPQDDANEKFDTPGRVVDDNFFDEWEDDDNLEVPDESGEGDYEEHSSEDATETSAEEEEDDGVQP